MSSIVHSLDVEKAYAFLDFLVTSEYGCEISVYKKMFSMMLFNTYNEVIFSYDTDTDMLISDFVRDSINSYLATNDGQEMVGIWMSQ